jgi:hypothetical protein
MPWTVESDRGCYIADAKGNYVVSQGIHPDLAEKFIQLAETYVKDGEKFTREFEVEQELPPGTLSNVGKGT